LTARIFSGDQAMLSIVSVAPNAKGEVHHHPQEQWVFCSRAPEFVFRETNRSR
jgi:hypothetical protein